MNENEKINILMVDDQPSKLLSYEAILGELGENLIKAGSAREAMEHLLKTDVAIVLMDVSMPELDGFELADIIRQHPRYQKTAIIFVSAVRLTDLDRVAGYERGAVDYVSVPVIPEILRAKVSVFAELYRKTRQLERLNSELEQRVAERTAELEASSARLRQSTEELQKLNAELMRSNRELDAFAYIASHDLKEPLRGIHNYSHFLLEDYADRLDEEGVRKLQTLPRLTQRMEALIDSLLHYSRVGRAEFALRDTDLEQVLNEALEALMARLTESCVEVRRPVRLPIVRADQSRVSEIFVNLISNAVKYNNKPEKWVEIGFIDCGLRIADCGKKRSEEVREQGEQESEKAGENNPPSDIRHPPLAVFYVRDNGIGIPAKHHENIFHIFRRLHGREAYGGGIGAGLTITRKIIERHGGRIWVESVPGGGATFYFTLEPEVSDGRRIAASHFGG